VEVQQQNIEKPEASAESTIENSTDKTSAQTTDEEVIYNELLGMDESDPEEVLNNLEETIEDEINPLDELTEEFEIAEIDNLEPEETIMDEQESSDFSSELILFNPDIWQEIGNDLWGEFEQIESEVEYAPIEEAAIE